MDIKIVVISLAAFSCSSSQYKHASASCTMDNARIKAFKQFEKMHDLTSYDVLVGEDSLNYYFNFKMKISDVILYKGGEASYVIRKKNCQFLEMHEDDQ